MKNFIVNHTKIIKFQPMTFQIGQCTKDRMDQQTKNSFKIKSRGNIELKVLLGFHFKTTMDSFFLIHDSHIGKFCVLARFLR